MRAIIVIAAFSMSLLGCNHASSVAEDKTAIAAVMQTHYARPNAAPSIEPIVVRHPYGIADWVQGDTGGRTLLRKRFGTWSVVTSTGLEMRDAAYLQQAGVPKDDAIALATQLIDAERSIDSHRLALLDQFGPKPDAAVAVLDAVVVQAK